MFSAAIARLEYTEAFSRSAALCMLQKTDTYMQVALLSWIVLSMKFYFKSLTKGVLCTCLDSELTTFERPL